MTLAPKRVMQFYKAFTADASAQQMLNARGYAGASGIDAGGRVDLGTATTAVVTVVDSIGRVLINGVTYTSDTDISPTAAGIVGPLLATVASSNGTLTVRWNVLK